MRGKVRRKGHRKSKRKRVTARERQRRRESEREREREREGRKREGGERGRDGVRQETSHSEPVVEFEEWKSDWSCDLKVDPPR